jgi:anti-sigma factor RsiW
MTCRELIEFLADYLDGALDTGARTAFEAHLAECPECIDYVRSYRETIRVARGAARVEDAAEAMPAALVDAIVAARRGR